MGPPSPEVTGVICRVPSTQFSQAPWYSLPVHLCRFRVRSHGGLFPGTAHQPGQSDKAKLALRSVTSSWPGTINPVPIDYASRPRLRGRLTLLRLALSRNPWTFGERVSHPLCRYSRQHSRYRSLHRKAYAPASSPNLKPAQSPVRATARFARCLSASWRSAPSCAPIRPQAGRRPIGQIKTQNRRGFSHGTLRYHAHCASEASARGLSPVTSSPQDSLTRPVSCYAFFK